MSEEQHTEIQRLLKDLAETQRMAGDSSNTLMEQYEKWNLREEELGRLRYELQTDNERLRVEVHELTVENGRLEPEAAMWKKSFGDLDRRIQKELIPEIARLQSEAEMLAEQAIKFRDLAYENDALILELASTLRKTMTLQQQRTILAKLDVAVARIQAGETNFNSSQNHVA